MGFMSVSLSRRGDNKKAREDERCSAEHTPQSNLRTKSHLIPAFGPTDLVDRALDCLTAPCRGGVALYVSGTRGFSVKGFAETGSVIIPSCEPNSRSGLLPERKLSVCVAKIGK